jgi:hypothetical protein
VRQRVNKVTESTSKQGHRVVVEHILRPEAMLQCKQELSTAARAWRLADGSGMRGARERAAGKGNRAGEGGGRRVGFTLAGGGTAAAAERRPGRSTTGGRRGNRVRHVLGEEEEREGGPGDLLVNSKNFRDLSVN